jgi:hypothetical protein
MPSCRKLKTFKVVEATPDIFLIFQMSKVASRSWLNLLKATVPDSTLAHFHTISEARIAEAERLATMQGDSQTIKHLTLPDLGRPRGSILQFIEHGKWVGPRTRIIAGVRDPVARAISAVGYLCNYLGYTKLAVTPRDGGTAENMAEVFYRATRMAQGTDTKDDTFITLVAVTLSYSYLWFREELAPGFGVDITDVPFDHQARCLTVNGPHQLFVYRVEDLMDKNAEQRMLESASEFIGKRVTSFPKHDASKESRYQALYSDFKNSIRLSDDDLAWFYDNEVVEKFYTPEEIETFKSRWARH